MSYGWGRRATRPTRSRRSSRAARWFSAATIRSWGRICWAFVLEPIDDRTTRLIVRSRGDYPPSPANFVIWRILTEPLHFVMERKMLLGIKQRAEAAAMHLVS